MVIPSCSSLTIHQVSPAGRWSHMAPNDEEFSKSLLKCSVPISRGVDQNDRTKLVQRSSKVIKGRRFIQDPADVARSGNLAAAFLPYPVPWWLWDASVMRCCRDRTSTGHGCLRMGVASTSIPEPMDANAMPKQPLIF